jgi:photosystem II stability/assembly factor-like uncharacterized protein
MKRKKVISFTLVGLICIISFNLINVNAHSPHDVIDSLVLSPNYQNDHTLFIIIKNTWVLKSLDGGYDWKYLNNGIDNKFKLTSISASPSFAIDHTLFVTTDGDGIFRSINGGKSWERVNNGLNNYKINKILFSPNYKLDNTVYALGGDGDLYMTENGGNNWKNVFNHNTKITAIAINGKVETQRPYLVIGDKNGILYSNINDQGFEEIFRTNYSDKITSAFIDIAQNGNGRVYFGTESGGLFSNTTSDGLFRKINNGIEDNHITSINIKNSKTDKKEIFFSTWNKAVYKSVDNGQNWELKNKGLTTDRQANSTEYWSPHFRNIVISSNFESDNTMFLAGFDGLFKTEDRADKWTQLETLPVNLIKGFAVSPPKKNERSSIAITTYGGGAYISDDDGISWTVRNLGLRKTRLSDIVFSTSFKNDGKLFTATAKYFYVFDDTQKKWTAVRLRDTSIRSRIYSKLVQLGISRDWLQKKVFGKTNLNIIWPNIISVSPNFANDKTLIFGSRYRGFFYSVDGGKTFSSISQDIKDINKKKITSMCISPNFSKDRVLFGAVRWEGVFKSQDGGRTWNNFSDGIKLKNEDKSMIPPYYVLAISPDYKNDQTVFVGTELGLFMTNNGGDNWQQIEITENGRDAIVTSVAISPNYKNDNTIIISLKGKGLIKSIDRGATWYEIGQELTNSNYLLEFISFSYSYGIDNTIWGASKEALFSSKNQGESWEKVKIPIVRYENSRDVIQYLGEWNFINGENYSAGSISVTEDKEAKAKLTFVGTGIRWIGTRSEKHGTAKIYIDGKFKGDFEQYNKTPINNAILFKINDLIYGPHTLELSISDNKNIIFKKGKIDFDAFDVFK